MWCVLGLVHNPTSLLTPLLTKLARCWCYYYLHQWVICVLLSRTVPSLKPTMLSWCWPTRAPCSSTRSPPHTPEYSWTSGGRCLATCPSTWLRKYTHSCQVQDRWTSIVLITISEKQPLVSRGVPVAWLTISL